VNAELRLQLDFSLRRSIAFLKWSQLAHGEFAGLVASDPDLSDGVLESSPFFTTFVLYALQQVSDASAPGMIDKAVRFLEEQKQVGGLWRYYSPRQHKHYRLPPDLDDTACASFALRQARWRTPENEWAFKLAQDEAGRFRTYFLPTGNIRMAVVLALGQFQARCYRRIARSSPQTNLEVQSTEVDIVPIDDVDPIVNANAILFLGEGEITKAAIEYLIRVFPEAREGEFSLYYRDKLILAYMIARAFRHSAPSLGVLKDPILSYLDARARSGELFQDALSAAMAASILITFDDYGSLLDALVDIILRLQGEDGSWKQHAFYTGVPGYWWGSRELTTGFCVEALARYVESDRVCAERQQLSAPAAMWNPEGLLTGPGGVDANWYLARYGEAAGYGSAAEHYANVGWREGKDPNQSFSTCAYLRANPDVAAAQLNPLVHFLRYGRREGRTFDAPGTMHPHHAALAGPDGVDADWYLTQYPQAAAYVSPAEHYDRVGWHQGKDPNPNFSTTLYLRANPDIAAAQINPLIHYLTRGRREGRALVEPEAAWNPAGVLTAPEGVDAQWYLARYPETASFVSAAAHYAYHGWREGKDPNPSFSTTGYLTAYPDVAAAEIDPLAHYLTHGRREGRTNCSRSTDVMRTKAWWPGKITAALAVSFATTLVLDIPAFSVLPLLASLVVALAACAAYVSVINDITDTKQDGLAGKPNAMKGRSSLLVYGIPAGCIVIGFCCCLLWWPHYQSVSLYLASWLCFSLYSLPPIRLKVRGLPGAVADALGAHVFPALLATTLIFYSQAANVELLWAGLVATWAFCYGLRSIISHQIADEPNDARAEVNTFVRRVGTFRALFISEYLLGPIELLSLALMIMRIGSVIVLYSALMYGMMSYVKHQFRPSLAYYGSFGTVSSYNSLVFPTALILASAVAHSVDLISAILFVLMFYRGLRNGLVQAYRQMKDALFPDHPAVLLGTTP
jgi:4-hydroxybenzoate polyprenyltransferase